MLHRLLLGLAHGDKREGDHRNRNRLDYRRQNLRIVSKGANGQNVSSSRGATSHYRGVSWVKAISKWMARVETNGKSMYLGVFANETEAAEVARVARKRLLPYATD